MRCEWCGKEHLTTADIVTVLVVGGVDGVVCRKCHDDFNAELADEQEYVRLHG